MKYLVTGATGHLGANLVRRLLADKHEVRVLLWDEKGADNVAVELIVSERLCAPC